MLTSLLLSCDVLFLKKVFFIIRKPQLIIRSPLALAFWTRAFPLFVTHRNGSNRTLHATCLCTFDVCFVVFFVLRFFSFVVFATFALWVEMHRGLLVKAIVRLPLVVLGFC